MNILSIGNSFSQDATRYLQNIAESAGESLYVRNLYIVFIGKFTESTVYRSSGMIRLYKLWGYELMLFPLRLKADYLGSASAYVNTNYYTHSASEESVLPHPFHKVLK